MGGWRPHSRRGQACLKCVGPTDLGPDHTEVQMPRFLWEDGWPLQPGPLCSAQLGPGDPFPPQADPGQAPGQFLGVCQAKLTPVCVWGGPSPPG